MIADMNIDMVMAASLLVLLVVVLQVPVWWKIIRLQRCARQQEAELQRLTNDMHSSGNVLASMDEYKLGVEQQLRRLAERQDQTDFREPVSPAYNHAIKLVQKGASIDELIATCGLVRGEAELLIRLHRLN